MTSTPDPKPGDQITWNSVQMKVTRLGIPTFPGGPALVYARPLDGVDETFVPAGEWEPSTAVVCDCLGGDPDSPEARPEPEWLTSLRKDIRTEAMQIAEDFTLDRRGVVALVDIATGVAASYLHPLHARIAELEKTPDGKTCICEPEINAAPNQDCPLHGESEVDYLRRRVAELEADVIALAGSRLALNARTTELGQQVRARGKRIESLAFDLRQQEELVQELRGARLDASGDMQAKVDALWSDLIDSAEEGRLRVTEARAIAERHMLLMAASTPPVDERESLDDSDYKERRWTEQRGQKMDPVLTFTGPPGTSASVAYNLASDRRPGFDDNHMCLEYGTRGHDCGEHETPVAAPLPYLPPPSEVTDMQVLQANPEMREVPLGEARTGDVATRTGVVSDVVNGIVSVRWDGNEATQSLTSFQPGLVITRPVSPLPDKPGAVEVGRVKDGDPVDPNTVHIVDIPGGAVRDVELWDVRPGDIFHVSLLVADVDGGAIIDIPKGWANFGSLMWEVPFGVATRITRPPIPDVVGSVGDARVRGKARANVVRSDRPGTPWMSCISVDGHTWHADSDLSDYLPLRDGQEADRG